MSSPDGSAPRPKLPGAGGRHSSSWLNRLHRHHDKKHHHVEEQRPLLSDDQPTDEDADVEPQTTTNTPPPEGMAAARQSLVHLAHKIKQRTTENWKAVVAAILLALFTVLVGTVVAYYKNVQGRANVCISPTCVAAAASILYNLDPSVSGGGGTYTYKGASSIDPCQDFDQYSCGGFDRHDLRPDQGSMFTGTLMYEASQSILRHILEGDTATSTDQKNFNKLKADYVACMDQGTIKAIGLDPLTDIVQNIKALFPVSTENWKASPIRSSKAQHGISASANDLTTAVLFEFNLGISPFISAGVGADDKHPEVQVVFVSPPWSIGLPSKEYYDNKSTVAEYQAVVTEVLGSFYQNSTTNVTRSSYNFHQTTSQSSALAEQVVTFETNLAAISPDPEDLNDITKAYNPRTVSNLTVVLPQINIGQIISKLAPAGFSAQEVIVASPEYIHRLSGILQQTSRETLQGYMVWKAIQSYSSRVEAPAITPLKRFNNRLQGKEPDAVEDRWRTCVRACDSDLGWILSKFFVDSAFSPSAKKFGDEIVSDIKDSFDTILKDAEWMTEEVRERSIVKVHAIDQKIGYPTSNPDILDPSALRKYYKTVSISNSTFFDNRVNAAEFAVHQEWSKLGRPTRHDEWGMTAPTVNAYYNPAGNEIVFPAGIMQQPVFYDPSVPKYLSYGAFGAVSGHELSHAFDNTGSQFDETGKYANWWDNDTRAAFEEKTECFVKQYSDFSIQGPDGSVHVNGRLTLGENVADAGGLHAAYIAWQKREADKQSESLPGLQKFSNEQLFFINYANWWCGKTTKQAALERIYVDPHAPTWARIIGTMANSAEFKEAFSCPKKKPTCELW